MQDRSIAYFTMEIALESRMPTYSGGLGVLAGDTVRSAADLEVPMVVVTLLHRKGYFRQRLDGEGNQIEEDVLWDPADFLTEMPARALVHIEQREVRLRSWRYDVQGIGGYVVPVYFLDADLPENAEADRRLTDHLYGGDDYYRLAQEVILGIGGIRMLNALGYPPFSKYHMNEGHAALLTVELVEEEMRRNGRDEAVREDLEAVHARCVFTTHTPVPAGHDQFSLDLVARVAGDRSLLISCGDMFCVDVYQRTFQVEGPPEPLRRMAQQGARLNMTYLALNLSSYVNGVAKKHGEVSRHMFAGYAIDAITNGVHAGRWVSPAFAALFDRRIPGWREDNFSLRYALGIPGHELWEAHQRAKEDLLAFVKERTGRALDPERLTLGFARRSATYKRATLLFADLDRLRRIAKTDRGLQIIYAGKAHPKDEGGKELIRKIFAAMHALGDEVPVLYLEDYDLEMAARMVAGVDVWLNTPQPPNEASGTSGMKSALNGVPSLSVLDGWWIEGCIEGITGWSLGDPDGGGGDPARDADSLYGKLEYDVMPCYYGDRRCYLDVMRQAIALNGSFFNTQRMIQQYVVRAYLD